MPYYHLYRQEQPDEFHQMFQRRLTLMTIHQIVLDGISDNMASLVESGKYGAINTTDTSTNGIYVIMFTSGAYTLQENTTINGQILIAGELVVNAKYLSSMQVDIYWYCNQQPKHHVITVPTRTIIHPQLEVNPVTDFHAITKSICTSTQSKTSISRHPVCLTDSDYDYILEKIGRRDEIEFERDVEVYSDDKED